MLHGTTLRVRWGSATHVGRVRDHNEDSLIADGMVFAVADGMGGHAAGEVASRITVAALATLVDHPPASTEAVAEVLREANRGILQSQVDSPDQRGMGTTVAGLTVVDGAPDGVADDVSRLVVATGRVRGATLDADYDVLQSVLETLVVGGAG